ELGVVGQDAQVARKGELETAPDGVSSYGRDGHQIGPTEPEESFLEFGDVGVEFGVVDGAVGQFGDDGALSVHTFGREHLEVDPRGKDVTFSGDHDDSDVLVQVLADTGQGGPGASGHRVALFGPADGDAGDGPVHCQPKTCLGEFFLRGQGPWGG